MADPEMEVTLPLGEGFSAAFAKSLWEHADPVAKKTLANRVIMALIDSPPTNLVNAFGLAVEAHVGPFVKQQGELLDEALKAFVSAKLDSTVDELVRPLLDQVVEKRLSTHKSLPQQVDKAIADNIKKRLPELRKRVDELAEPIVKSVASDLASRLRNNLEAEIFEPKGSLYESVVDQLRVRVNAVIEEIVDTPEMKQTIAQRAGENIGTLLMEQRASA